MELSSALRKIEEYYSQKIATYGATPRGVDWNSAKSQHLRFQQLLRAFTDGSSCSVNDYGCGYGALADYLAQNGYSFRYHGFDISEQMIAHARELHGDMTNCQFSTEEGRLAPADYTLASGIFNVKLGAENTEWLAYVLKTVSRMASLSVKGLAFNLLTKYSDRDRMRADLYYADPLFLFDYCMNNLSRSVSLFHDYPLFEFTIAVRLV